MFKEQSPNEEQEPSQKYLSHPDLSKEANNYIDSLMKQAGEIIKDLNKAKQEKDIDKQIELGKKLITILDLITQSKRKKRIVREGEEEKPDPEEIRKSIEEINKELGLDISFEIDNNGVVSFQDAKEKLDQIITILTQPDNKLTSLGLYNNDLKAADAQAIAEALKDPSNKLTSLDLEFNLIANTTQQEIKELVESLKKQGREIELGF